MSEPTTVPAVTWRRRVVRRVAGSIGAAVVIAGIGPALANAAGADVANPVTIALRASGRGVQKAFGGSSDATLAQACETPTATAEPTVEPSVEPTVEPSVEPSVEPTETATPEPTAEPTSSVEPTAVPTLVPTETVSATPTCEEESASPSATPTAAPSSEEPEADDAEDGAHGKIVSTVAHCAPKGRDPLLDAEGAPANHGGYVKAAAHGDTLTTPWGAFDLSTQAGADDLCAAVAAAREALPDDATAKPGKSGQDHGKSAKDHAKGPKSR